MVSKVIAQSGSALADWAVIIDKYRAQNTSRVYAEMLGCSIESSWKLVQCLKDGRSFLELGNSELKPHVGMFPWAPVLDFNFTIPQDNWYEDWRASDWRFFAETPEESIKAYRYKKDLAYMAGVTTQEAAFIISMSSINSLISISLCLYLFASRILLLLILINYILLCCRLLDINITLYNSYIAENNVTLARNRYIINSESFDQKVWELVLQYNYTLNPQGVYEAIKYMYTYWPDPTNVTHIRDQYIKVSNVANKISVI